MTDQDQDPHKVYYPTISKATRPSNRRASQRRRTPTTWSSYIAASSAPTKDAVAENPFTMADQTLSALDFNEVTLIDDLIYRFHHTIQRQLATGDEHPTSLREIALRCQRIHQSLKDAERNKAPDEMYNKPKSTPSGPKPTPTTMTRTTTISSTAAPHSLSGWPVHTLVTLLESCQQKSWIDAEQKGGASI
ncbi:hypothetical protein MMC22_011251, partial [Lobaria immixta]|nr:hypothetical protein [Lobaria immixta]